MLKKIDQSIWLRPINGLLGLACIYLSMPLTAMATSQDVEGMASVPYSATMFSSHVDESTRQQALLAAELDALERYASSFSASKYKLYQRAESDIKAHLQDYISQPVVVDEGIKKDNSQA